MYQPGEMIVYGSSGVCEVKEICKRKTMSGEEGDYYQLSPVYSTEMIYTPIDTGVFMRPILTQVQAEGLLNQIPEISQEVYYNNNISMLRAHYEAFFQTHQCEDLLKLIKSIHLKNEEALRNKKKLGRVEQHYLKLAQELLCGELSVALDLPRETVTENLQNAVEQAS